MDSIKKYLSCTLLLASFLCLPGLDAEQLLFKAGDSASYIISEKIVGESEFLLESEGGRQDSTVALDVKILAVDSTTLSYPFDVEVTFRGIQISSTDEGAETITYESGKPSTVKNTALVNYYNQLIDRPLHFRVEKEFQVKEMTGHLAKAYEDYDASTEALEDLDLEVCGATQWGFEFFLTQLFHCAGQDLVSGDACPVSCYQLLNWEDAALEEEEEEEENEIMQSSLYSIDSVDSQSISASWNGDAKVNESGFLHKGSVSVQGNVVWDVANPLLQKRDLKAHIVEKYIGIFRLKLAVEQTWDSKSNS